VRVEVADAAMAVPSFERANTGSAARFCVHVNAAIRNHRGKARKPIKTMGINPVAGGFGEEASAHRSSSLRKAKAQNGFVQGIEEIGVGNSEHKLL
jgi:hypothetical protein